MNATNCMAMVVAYHPGPEFSDLVDSLTSQFEKILVVDNGDCCTTRKIWDRVRQRERIDHLCNYGNIGIGEALNRGLEYARQHGYHWLVTFDHDSHIGTGFAQVLFEAETRVASADKPIAVIGPRWRRHNGQSDMSPLIDSSQSRYCPIPTIITSGSCFHVETALRLGGFREDYFIDSVDHEFCLRARSKGYEVLLDSHLAMEHCLGDESRHRFLRRNYWVTNHSVIRRYYISRNKILLWFQFLSVFPRWVMRDIKLYGMESIKILAFEKYKTKKLFAMLLGYLHAVTGVRGKLHERYMRFFES